MDPIAKMKAAKKAAAAEKPPAEKPKPEEHEALSDTKTTQDELDADIANPEENDDLDEDGELDPEDYVLPPAFIQNAIAILGEDEVNRILEGRS